MRYSTALAKTVLINGVHHSGRFDGEKRALWVRTMRHAVWMLTDPHPITLLTTGQLTVLLHALYGEEEAGHWNYEALNLVDESDADETLDYSDDSDRELTDVS